MLQSEANQESYKTFYFLVMHEHIKRKTFT